MTDDATEAIEVVRPVEPGEPVAPPSDRPSLVRRLVASIGIIVVLLLVLRPFWERFYGLRAASDWGSDWKWLQDGLDRLARGLPLTRPEYVTGPWSQFPAPSHAPTYAWSLHPPYGATMYAPFLVVPDEFRAVAFAAVMAIVLAAAVWVAWPRRLWWGTGALIVAAMLWLPDFGKAWPGLIDQVHYANPNAIVILGVALVWVGRRRDSVLLMALGLVLAAVKIAPAGTLALWLLVARDRPVPARRAVFIAAIVLAILSVPILFLDPGAVTDMIRSQLNLEPWTGSTNLAPQVLLTPVMGKSAATLLSYGSAALLMLIVLVRRLDGPGGFLLAATAPLLATPQLWAHWFLIPEVALLATAGEWRIVRALDGWLRDVVDLGPAAPVPPAAPIGGTG